MAAADQLLDMLKTIDDAGGFLRRRCAAGLAGQSLGLFQDLSSLIELMGDRFAQTEYLPKRLPLFSDRADALTAIAYLDQVDDWSRDIRDRVQRQKVRRGLAMGSLYDLAETEGKPFVAEARELAGMFRYPSQGTVSGQDASDGLASGLQGSPEERAAATEGVTVSFSSGASKTGSAGRTRAGMGNAGTNSTGGDNARMGNAGTNGTGGDNARMGNAGMNGTGGDNGQMGNAGTNGAGGDNARTGNAGSSGAGMNSAQMEDNGLENAGDEPGGARASGSRSRGRPRGFDASEESARLFEAVNARVEQTSGDAEMPPVRHARGGIRPSRAGRNSGSDAGEQGAAGGGARPMRAAGSDAGEQGTAGGGARPMRAAGSDAGEQGAAGGGARPMRAAGSDAGEQGAAGGSARPMDAKQPSEEPVMASQAERPERTRRSRSAPKPSPSPVLPGPGNAVDRGFSAVMDQIEAMDEGELSQKLVNAFPKLENRYRLAIVDTLQRLPQLGRFVPERNEYGALRRRAAELVNHRLDFLWLYGKLGDFRSKKTLLAILDNWFSFNLKDLTNMKEKMFEPYLDADLLNCGADEVFVDLGAYIGEVSKEFASLAGTWNRIYCYEMHPGSFASLSQNLSPYPNVELRMKGVWEKAGSSRIVIPSGDPAEARLDAAGSGDLVEAVSLDADITERVSIIKMCLNGGEQAAIRGCADHIHKDHPRLAVRVDFILEDLWKIPRMIERLDPKYRFYLRHYGGNLVPAEFVLYAV